MTLIKFNKEIYPLKAIKMAVGDYSRVVKLSISNANKYTIIKINGIDSKLNDQIKDEFCNYVLSLVKTD